MTEVRTRPWPGVDGKCREHEIIVDRWPPIVTILEGRDGHRSYSWRDGTHTSLEEVSRMIEALCAARDLEQEVGEHGP